MKKAIYNKSGMKQIVNTGFKLFDKQTNCITTENAICNTQVSSSIRPFSECECNGMMFAQGHLLDADIKWFAKYVIPQNILKVLKDRERKESVILYMFFTTDKEFRIQPFFWVVTDYNHKLITQCLLLRHRQWAYKRIEAANEILKYITD